MAKKPVPPPRLSAAATLVLMVEYDHETVAIGAAKEVIDALVDEARGHGTVTKAFVQYAPTEARIVTLVGDAE